MRLFKKFPLIMILMIIISCEETPENVQYGCIDTGAVNYDAYALEDDGTCTYNLSNLIQLKPWYISSVTADLGLDDPTDLLALLPDLIPSCTHDNIFTFFDDGSVEMDDHIEICEEDEVSLIDLSGQWTINGNQLNIQNGNNLYELEVKIIYSNEIELNFPYNFSETVIVPAKITLMTI